MKMNCYIYFDRYCTYIHACMHACIHTQTLARTHARTHAYLSHTQTHHDVSVYRLHYDRCRSVYTVSDKRLRHGGSGYETRVSHNHFMYKKLLDFIHVH